MQKIKTFVCLLSLIILISGCGARRLNSSVDTANLYQLEGISAEPSFYAKKDTSPMRTQMLEDIAMSLGAQGGLAWASNQMNVRMTNDKKYLESIFNFSGMMLSHGVLPPVLEEGDNTLNLADPNTIRVADRIYRIVKQARFATTPPNWREYLWMDFTKPEVPDRTLLPRNAEEQKIWQHAIRVGWTKGIQQGYAIFEQSLASLKRDFRGMILYRKLLQERMVSPPFVSRTELGITGDGNDMRINDQVLRIVEPSQLQVNSEHWKPIVVKRTDE